MSESQSQPLGQKRDRSEEQGDVDDDQLLPPPSSTNVSGVVHENPNPRISHQDIPRANASSTTTTTTRLVIKDIVVNNFKSYAGIHTIGPFHKTFTATIGPNGSGKSNVIDAMLFVFGKNAKKIRLEKLSELIHSSAAFPNLNHASVQVNFVLVRESEADKKDPNQRLEVPGSDFSVSREVYRSNQSQYFVNNKKSTQRDVVELLTGHGIDLDHNRFLILQGEVEQIALMKPKAEKEGEEGLVEYFDDLIGSNKYETTIREAAKIAEENQSLRLDQLDSLKRVQGERDALSGAKDSAYGYIRKFTHLQRIITVMCQLTLRDSEAELQAPRARVNAIKTEISAIEYEIAQREDKRGEIVARCAERKAAVATAKKEHADLIKEKQAADQRLEEIRAGADENNKHQKKLQDRLRKCQQDLRDLVAQIGDADTNISIASGSLEEGQSELARLEPIYEKRTDDLLIEMKPLRQKVGLLKQQIAPYESAVTTSKLKYEDAQHRANTLSDDHAKHQETLASLIQEKAEMQNRRNGVLETIHTSETSGRDVEGQITQLNEQIAKLSKQKHQINGQIEAIKHEHRDQQNGDKVMTLLSQQALPKYFGTLRQLGRIAEEYDVAAGVASNFWGHHIVQDQETARKAVAYLKTVNERATFLILDDVERNNRATLNRGFQCPPGSQRLYDLIKPTNAKFEIAFYAAVKDTLVCKDLTTARKVSYMGSTRHRVVTPEGGIVEKSGALTGGGGRPQGAKLQASHAPADREVTRQRLGELQAELNIVVANERELENKVSDLAHSRVSFNPQDIRRLKLQLSQLEATLQNFDRRIRDAEERVVASSASIKELPALERAARAAEIEYEAAEKELLKNSAALKDTERELETVGGDEYVKMGVTIKNFQANVKKQQERLTAAKTQRHKASVTKDSKEKDISKVEAELEKLKQEADQATKAEGDNQVNIVNELTQKCGGALTNVKSAEHRLREAEEEYAAAQHGVSELEKKKDDLDRTCREEESQMSEKLVKIKGVKDRVASCREQILKYAVDFGTSALRSPDSITVGGDIFGRVSSQKVLIPRTKREREEDDDGSSDSDEDATTTTIAAANYDDEIPEDDEDFDQEAFSLEVSAEDLDSYELPRCSTIARDLRNECERLRTTIDLTAVGSWRDKQTEYLASKARYEEIVSRVMLAEQKLEEVTVQRRELFMASFKIIQRKLKEMYQLLAHGGDADVDLVDSSDPYEGVNFTVRPPKKSWKQVSNLSGGEKTLSSLALVFALHHIRPTPIYVMDEIDAALDFRNVSIVAMYVLEQAQGAQFLIISLRNNMFELAHQLVGINKVNDVTRSLTLNPGMLANLIAKRLKEAKDAKAIKQSQRQLQHQQSSSTQ